MVVGAMCSTKVFPLIKVPPKVTVNAKYFVSHVLEPLVEKYLLPHFGNNIGKVTIHFDKASSHTAHFTRQYLQSINQKYGIKFLEKEDIPTKGADISPCDFFAFGYLKQRMKGNKCKTAKGLWNKARTVWAGITPESCHNTFASWKRRCLAVRRMDGDQYETIQGIHESKIKI